MNKTSCVTSVTMQFAEKSLVTCLICTKTVKKMYTLKSDINTYSSLENNIQEMAKSQKQTHTYAEAAMLNCNKK